MLLASLIRFDGPFLHIMRHYKPQKAYIFMTKEICEYDDVDNRYEELARRLCKLEGFACEVVKYKRYDIVNPQDFEIFFNPFREIIDKIVEENPAAEIIVNLSSGTPQIKAACYYICAVYNKAPLKPVQVITPEGKGNDEKSVSKIFHLEEEWANLIDNQHDLPVENRCREVKIEYMNAMIGKEIMIGHVRNYDYDAALLIAEKISRFLEPRIPGMIRIGKYRLKLKIKEMMAEASALNLATPDIFPVQQGNVMKCFEYILNLSVKVRKGELVDFTRGISPAVTELFENYLSCRYHVNIRQYCIKKSGRSKRPDFIKRDMMPPEIASHYDRYFSNGESGSESGAFSAGDSDRKFRDGDLMASNILPMILYYENDPEIIGKLECLRTFEKNARNIAAHEMVDIDDRWLKAKTGLTGNEAMQLLKDLFCRIYPQYNKRDIWNCYDMLNKEIIQLL